MTDTTKVWVVTSNDPGMSDPFTVEGLISQNLAKTQEEAVDLAQREQWKDLLQDEMTWPEYEAHLLDGNIGEWEAFLMPIMETVS